MKETRSDKDRGGERWRYLGWRGVKWGAWGVVVLVMGVMSWSHFQRTDWTLQWDSRGAGGEVRETVLGLQVGVGRVSVEAHTTITEGGRGGQAAIRRAWWWVPERYSRRVSDQRVGWIYGDWGQWWWTWESERVQGKGSASTVDYARFVVMGVSGNRSTNRSVLVWSRAAPSTPEVTVIRQTGVSTPMVYVALVAAGVAWFAGRRERRALGRWWWEHEGRCEGCGYDLRGVDVTGKGRCSECGREWGGSGGEGVKR